MPLKWRQSGPSWEQFTKLRAGQLQATRAATLGCRSVPRADRWNAWVGPSLAAPWARRIPEAALRSSGRTRFDRGVRKKEPCARNSDGRETARACFDPVPNDEK